MPRAVRPVRYASEWYNCDLAYEYCERCITKYKAIAPLNECEAHANKIMEHQRGGRIENVNAEVARLPPMAGRRVWV